NTNRNSAPNGASLERWILCYRICYRFWEHEGTRSCYNSLVFAPLAQLAEQVTLNHWVAGSIPARCISFAVCLHKTPALIRLIAVRRIRRISTRSAGGQPDTLYETPRLMAFCHFHPPL